MAEPDLIIGLPELVGDPWHWMNAAGQSGLAVSDADKLALGESSPRQTMAIIPGQCVRRLTLDIPDVGAKQKLAAARFAAEPQIGQALEDAHLVMSARNPEDVFVVDRVTMLDFVTVLNEAGLGQCAIYADFDCRKDDAGQVLFDDRLITPGAMGYSEDITLISAPSGDPISFVDLVHDTSLDEATNLRQGEFAAKSSLSVSSKLLVGIAASAVFALLTGLLSYGFQTGAISKQAEQLRTDNAARYQQITGETAPSRPGLALSRQSAGGSSSGSMLNLSMSALIPALQNSADAELLDVRYDGSRGDVFVTISFADLDAASALEQQVKATGLGFEQRSLRESDGRFLGEARLFGGPS